MFFLVTALLDIIIFSDITVTYWLNLLMFLTIFVDHITMCKYICIITSVFTQLLYFKWPFIFVTGVKVEISRTP